MTKYNELPQLPKIEKNKLIILLNQNAVRDTNFIRSFEKPRDFYLFSILLHNEIIRTKENITIEVSIKELQEKYKIFRGESKYDLMNFLWLAKEIFPLVNQPSSVTILYSFNTSLSVKILSNISEGLEYTF